MSREPLRATSRNANATKPEDLPTAADDLGSHTNDITRLAAQRARHITPERFCPERAMNYVGGSLSPTHPPPLPPPSLPPTDRHHTLGCPAG